jgi:hypothetical protein
MKRAGLVLAATWLTACGAGAEKAPQVVDAGHKAACKADTSTLKAMEDTSFATTNAYREQTTPLHKATASGDSYTITIADKRCGTVGHVVGQTPADY